MNEDFFAKLKKQLEESTEWPTVYMFKFIVPADNKKLALVESLFSAQAKISTRSSNKGKYISVTGRVVMLSAAEVIEKYKEAAKIEGLIAL